MSKGAFFHHFASKEDLAIAAADHWSVTTGGLFADAAYHELDDPADRVLGYLDFRASIIGDDIEQYTGTQVVLQGAFVVSKAANNPELARDSVAHLRHHFEMLFHPHQGA